MQHVTNCSSGCWGHPDKRGFPVQAVGPGKLLGRELLEKKVQRLGVFV